jgi:site-specific DNA recombinase
MTENEVKLYLSQFAKGIKTPKSQKERSAVMYTRVSSKEQTENLSLDVQRKGILAYAERNGYSIVETYGGTYESAKNEERVEFQRMMEFVRRNKKTVSAILIYSMDRFSRSGSNAIYISSQLREQGIEIIAITSPTDSYTPSGELHQNIMLVFSHFDNQQRRMKTIEGMREKLLRGYWVGIAPRGYKYCGTKEKRLVHSDLAPIIRRAFEMKGRDGFTNVEIARQLNPLGLKVHNKTLSKIFSNVTYLGYLSCNLLEGEIIKGQHEAIVDEELFFKVNNLKRVITKRIKETEAKAMIPLKNFVICSSCMTHKLTGYEVSRRKGNWYYKCSIRGCKNNINAGKLHTLFFKLLKSYTVHPDKIPAIRKKLREMMLGYYSEQVKDQELLMGEIKNINSKIDILDERFAYGEIEKPLYQKVFSKEKKDLLILEKKLLLSKPNSIPSIDAGIDEALGLARNMDNMWLNGDVYQKRRLQKLVFPKGLIYDSFYSKLEVMEMEHTLFALQAFK